MLSSALWLGALGGSIGGYIGSAVGGIAGGLAGGLLGGAVLTLWLFESHRWLFPLLMVVWLLASVMSCTGPVIVLGLMALVLYNMISK